MTSLIKNNDGTLIVFGSTCFIGRHLVKTLLEDKTEPEVVGYHSRNANLLDEGIVDRLRRELTAKDTLLILSANTLQTGANMNEFRTNMTK